MEANQPQFAGADGRRMKTSTIDVAGLDGALVRLTSEQLDEFESRVECPLLRSDDASWDDAVLVWNGMVAKAPAVVLQPASARDVAAAVGFARDHGLLLSIKGGGHNMAGTSIAERGLTLDMSRMRDVTVDPDARLAQVGPGCLLQDVDRATQAHGLATPLGSFSSEVGVAGLTLGGGLGYLTRRFGWTADNLEEVEIVTADGQIRTANREENTELFWALRGGGGNFGVVTRFTFRLHDVGPTVTGGLIVWSADRVDDVLATYRNLTESAPRELTAAVSVRLAPPAPFLPEDWHGRPIVALLICHSGADAAADLAPVRTLGDPIADLVTEKPYTDQQSMFDGDEPKGHRYYWKTEYLAGLTNEFLDIFRDSALKVTSPLSASIVIHLAGELNERADDDGAVGNRDARYMTAFAGQWQADSPDDEHVAWVREAWKSVRPFSTGGNYLNFQTADEDEERVRATYGANFDRLVAVKNAYDSQNLFRRNRNIRPRARAG
ncbi:FAD/FMN-containing dehydrogenase [Kribbella sp. VKM Ac-2568]|nr:FAD/FMN-containing dehydrogenase [Kribbella sp. VKM Ac-2568]